MATNPQTDTPAPPEYLQREESALYDRHVLDYIQHAAATGLYEIRGLGAKRRLPHFDDLTFLAASLSRYPLEGYREKCTTRTVLGARHGAKPIELEIPITIAGMSFGALSANVKEALGRAATALGTSTTTGDGGMTAEERVSSKTLVYQCLPSRYGFNPDDLRRADAIEVVIGQGAKPGGGGMLLGQKISPRVAKMRTLPEGIDQRSACRHPDWTGPDDLAIKIRELREITDWKKPIYVKVGATRVYHDVKLCVHAGADVIVVDGMQGGTAATQLAFIEHVGIPTLAAVRQAVAALEDMNMKEQVQLIVSGGIRSGADVAKALAMGADAVAIGQGVLMALGCNSDSYVQKGRHLSAVADYRKLNTAPGYCHHCHTGRCPVGVTTQDPVLEQRLEPDVGANRVRNYLKTLNMELTMIARACGKQDVHHLEREDLVALTIESAAMAGVPLAGTSWIPGAATPDKVPIER
jgi:glutamate synthase domain-containing protein 2